MPDRIDSYRPFTSARTTFRSSVEIQLTLEVDMCEEPHRDQPEHGGAAIGVGDFALDESRPQRRGRGVDDHQVALPDHRIACTRLEEMSEPKLRSANHRRTCGDRREKRVDERGWVGVGGAAREQRWRKSPSVCSIAAMTMSSRVLK